MSMRLNYWDLTGQIHVEQMPLCPLCDQPMVQGEELKIVEVDRCLGLAHSSCCLEADEDDEDD